MRPLPFVLAATDQGTLILPRHDRSDFAGQTYGVGHQLLTTGVYDPHEINVMISTLRDLKATKGREVVALDCGANIGVATVAMAKEMSGWGRVVAVEAQERLFYALCGNIALNNLANASAIWGAVCDQSGHLSIPTPDYNKQGSFGSLELRRTPTTEFIGQSVSYAKKDLVSVPALRVDDLGLAVDFLKVDVEGMEAEVLLGAFHTLEESRPVVFIEWIKTGQAAVREALAPFGYDFLEVGMNLLATPSRVRPK